MNITEEQSRGVAVLAPAGRIDSATAGEFETRLVQAVGGGNRVVVDMAQLGYISSAGLRALLVAAKKARPVGGKVALAAMSPPIREVFDLSGFSSLFEIYPDRPAAVAALAT